MQENNLSSSHQAKYRVVKANKGSIWLKDAYLMFKMSIATWLGITAFLIMVLLVPILNNIIALLMPILLGGLMIGCHQITTTTPIKFDHLFSGLKKHGKELLILSSIYAIASLIIMFATLYVMQLFNVNTQDIIPSNANQMSAEEIIEWAKGIDQSKVFPILLLALLISLALMIPLFMAIWFAPAIIVLQKQSAIQSFKLSFLACKDNFMPFLIYGLFAFAYLILFFFTISLLLLIIPILAIPAMIFGYLGMFAISLISIYTAYIDLFNVSENSTVANNESNSNNNSAKDDDSSMLA